MSDFNLDWQKPIHLALCDTLIYKVELDRIPKEPGIYIFFRAFGSSQIPMYVGQAKDLRERIKSQLKTNVKLMTGIRNSPQGSRQLAIGVFKPKKGQRRETSLDRMERALIRHSDSFCSRSRNYFLSSVSSRPISQRSLRLAAERKPHLGIIETTRALNCL